MSTKSLPGPRPDGCAAGIKGRCRGRLRKRLGGGGGRRRRGFFADRFESGARAGFESRAQRFAQAARARRRPGDETRIDRIRLARRERAQPRVPNRLAARLRKQLQRRTPAAGNGDEIEFARHGRIRNRLAVGIHARNVGDDGIARDARENNRAGRVQSDSGIERAPLRRFACGLAQIDNLDPRAGRGGIDSRAIGAVVVGENGDRAPRQNRVSTQIRAHRRSEHHARIVVAGKNERTLERAGGDNDARRANPPQAHARRGAVDSFGDGQVIVIVISGHHRPRQNGHIVQPPQFGERLLAPRRGRRAVDGVVVIEKRNAHNRMLLGQYHARAGFARGEGGGESGRAAADNQNLAMGVAVQIRIRIGPVGRGRGGCGAANAALVKPPQLRRPHKGLVIKSRRHQARKPARRRADIESRRRPAALAFGDEAIEQFHHRRARAGLQPRAFADGDNRARLFDSGRIDSARAAVFKTARERANAAGEQRGSERVADESRQRFAVE